MMIREPGEYCMRAVSVELGESKNGNPFIAVQLTCKEGDITWYGYFTEKTEVRTIESLRIMGWQGDDIDSLCTADLQNEVIVVCDREEYEGRERIRAQWINRPHGVNIKNKMQSDARKAFAARLRLTAAAIPKEPVRAAAEAKLPDDDDIPF